MTDTGMEPNEEDRNQSNETGHVTAVATPPDFAFANLAEPALFASTGNVFNGDAWKSDARVTPFGANNESSRPLAFAPVAAANREGNFFKAARWAPDGSCVLASTNDNCLRVFGFPQDDGEKPLPLSAISIVSSAEPVYDFQFYPYFSFMDPSSAVFLSSSRDHPVHLWDAYSGTVRCAYQTYDHLDQIMGPNSLCFTPDGSKIYCGFENCVQVFETSRPGNEGWKFSTTPTRKAKEGQKGIISTIAFCPDRSGLWAAGSYGRTIGLYDERQDGALYILSDGDVDDDQIRRATVPGRTPSPNRRTMGGVTQVTFSPDGMYLYSASRKDNLILCWDIRNSDAVLCAFDRGPSDTNQRMSFDVDGAGKWLVAGDTEGVVSVFGLDGPRTAVADTEIGYDGNVGLDGGKNRIQKTWSVHQDTVSSAAFHPTHPYLLTSSGSRKFPGAWQADDSDEETEAPAMRSDNSLRIWDVTGRPNTPAW